MRLVESDADAYDRFYNIVANPMLWFIQHYLWDLSNAPDIRRHEVEAFEFGYNVVNEDLARGGHRRDRGRRRAGRDGPRLPPLHAARRSSGPRAPTSFLHHFVHIPWTQPDAWRVLPGRSATRSTGACWPTTSSASTPAPTAATSSSAAATCSDLDVDIDERHRAASTTARSGCAPTRCRSTAGDARARGRRARVAEFERELLRRRREYLILRVDRADLSKNVLRGFTAFDIFLEQHPEFREQVTFIAQLMPSRTDVPEYAEYLEQIEALVAVVNHRHGTPDWMPIDLKLRDDLDEAIAAYKHYDVMIVNAMFDGMNLVAKEGPLVNERDGVSILSREHRRARGAR